jgi:hypothetical protein
MKPTGHSSLVYGVTTASGEVAGSPVLPDKPIVLSMRADPEPGDSGLSIRTEYAVVNTDACGPDSTNLLQME